MRRNHKNIRTEFKHLRKNYQRGMTQTEIHNKLLDKGLYGDTYWIEKILRTNLSTRLISRLGRAAKKQNKLLRLADLWWVYRMKAKTFQLIAFTPSDYHLIEFVKTEENKN
jgi:hypothetical protein